MTTYEVRTSCEYIIEVEANDAEEAEAQANKAGETIAKIIDRFREIGIDARKSGQRISFDGAIAGRLLELVLWEAAMGPQSGQR